MTSDAAIDIAPAARDAEKRVLPGDCAVDIGVGVLLPPGCCLVHVGAFGQDEVQSDRAPNRFIIRFESPTGWSCGNSHEKPLVIHAVFTISMATEADPAMLLAVRRNRPHYRVTRGHVPVPTCQDRLVL
jgi:hypothetical protein